MYLHLGQNVIVCSKDVVGIFDLDTSTIGKTTKQYLRNAEKEKKVLNVSSFDLPKSFILCTKEKKTKVFLSPLASSTLEKRYENGPLDFHRVIVRGD